ncbi:MAG TPA: 50S ribosomal protein L4 [Candidatus Limnocylindrales bacterium]|nr:50S ribosomal protein L4 [Candidatus Limnocylindrales bacterium]
MSQATVAEGPAVKVVDQTGKETGEVRLPASIFGAPVDGATLHQAVVRQQANERQGTHETKTRGEVSGGGKKPWRQKGTGRARQGSTRAPQWRHGGIVFGPHPHTYEQKMPRKQRRLALRVALSDRSQAGAIRVIEEIQLDAPRTKTMVTLFQELGATAPALLVLPEHDLMLEKSTRNLPGVKTLLVSNLNLQDVLTAETVIFTRAALTALEEWLGS